MAGQDQNRTEDQESPAPPGFHETESGGLHSPEGSYDPGPDSGFMGGHI